MLIVQNGYYRMRVDFPKMKENDAYRLGDHLCDVQEKLEMELEDVLGAKVVAPAHVNVDYISLETDGAPHLYIEFSMSQSIHEVPWFDLKERSLNDTAFEMAFLETMEKFDGFENTFLKIENLGSGYDNLETALRESIENTLTVAEFENDKKIIYYLNNMLDMLNEKQPFTFESCLGAYHDALDKAGVVVEKITEEDVALGEVDEHEKI